MHLFQRGDFTLASGQSSSFKIDCDALTWDDWETIASLLSVRLPRFGVVEGVPQGGLLLADALSYYRTCACGHLLNTHRVSSIVHCLACDCTSFEPEGPLLLVDDVYTTGSSLDRQRAGREALGAVFLARNPVAPWVTPLLVMTPEKES